jgi:hypothetical protein
MGELSPNPACPRCGSSLNRVHRRSIDMLISRFIAVKRYRCTSMLCIWEGNLRARSVGRSCADGSLPD